MTTAQNTPNLKGQLHIAIPGFKLTDYIDLSIPNHGFPLKSIKETVFGEGLEEFPDTTSEGHAIFNAYAQEAENARMDYVSGTFTYGDSFTENDVAVHVTKKQAMISLIEFIKINLTAVVYSYGWEAYENVANFLTGFDKMIASEDKMELESGTFLAGTVIEDRGIFLIGSLMWGLVKDPDNEIKIPYITLNMGILAGDYAEAVIEFLNSSMAKKEPTVH